MEQQILINNSNPSNSTIKSLQRGAEYIGTGSTEQLTISPVNINKSVVTTNSRVNDLRFLNATTLTCTASTGDNIYWEVIEYV